MSRKYQTLRIIAQLDGLFAADDCSPADADRWKELKRHIIRMKDGLDLWKPSSASGASAAWCSTPRWRARSRAMPGSGSIRKSDAEGSTCSRTAEGRAGGGKTVNNKFGAIKLPEGATRRARQRPCPALSLSCLESGVLRTRI